MEGISVKRFLVISSFLETCVSMANFNLPNGSYLGAIDGQACSMTIVCQGQACEVAITSGQRTSSQTNLLIGNKDFSSNGNMVISMSESEQFTVNGDFSASNFQTVISKNESNEIDARIDQFDDRGNQQILNQCQKMTWQRALPIISIDVSGGDNGTTERRKTTRRRSRPRRNDLGEMDMGPNY